jgi:hypothetical protein
MIAVPSPPLRIAPAGAPERLAVVASDDEEGVELLGIEFLDAFPSSEKVRKRFLVACPIGRLELADVPPLTVGGGMDEALNC